MHISMHAIHPVHRIQADLGRVNLSRIYPRLVLLVEKEVRVDEMFENSMKETR